MLLSYTDTTENNLPDLLLHVSEHPTIATRKGHDAVGTPESRGHACKRGQASTHNAESKKVRAALNLESVEEGVHGCIAVDVNSG